MQGGRVVRVCVLPHAAFSSRCTSTQAGGSRALVHPAPRPPHNSTAAPHPRDRAPCDVAPLPPPSSSGMGSSPLKLRPSASELRTLNASYAGAMPPSSWLTPAERSPPSRSSDCSKWAGGGRAGAWGGRAGWEVGASLSQGAGGVAGGWPHIAVCGGARSGPCTRTPCPCAHPSCALPARPTARAPACRPGRARAPAECAPP